MAKLVCCLFVVFLVQLSLAEEQQQQKDFQEFLDNAKKYLDGWASDVKKNVGLSADPSGEEIVKVFREHNEKLAQNLKESGKKIENELKSNPNLQSVLDNIKAKFNEEAEKLKKSNPDLAANAENLGKSVQGTWDSLTQEMEKSYKEFNKAGGKREEIENYFESLLDKVKAGAKDLETKLSEINKKSRR